MGSLDFWGPNSLDNQRNWWQVQESHANAIDVGSCNQGGHLGFDKLTNTAILCNLGDQDMANITTKTLLEVNHTWLKLLENFDTATLWNLFSCKPCRRRPSLSRLTEWNGRVGSNNPKPSGYMLRSESYRTGFYNDFCRSLGSGSPKCSRTSRPIIRALAKHSSLGAYGLLCGSLGAKGLNSQVPTPELSHHLLCFLSWSHHRKPLSTIITLNVYTLIYRIHMNTHCTCIWNTYIYIIYIRRYKL